MKSCFKYLIMGMLCACLLAACASQSLPPTPTPTLPPTPTRMPLPTLPTAEAMVTFEGKQCAYDGPQSIPANMTFTVNWYVYSNASDLYGLYAFIVGDGKTEEDLVAALKRDGAPPSWLTQAGSFDAQPNSSQQVTLKTAEGPLFGPLYLACFLDSSGSLIQVLGPINVE